MKVMFIITLGFALTWVYLFVDENTFIKMPPLYNGTMTKIRLQSFIDYGVTRILYCGFVYLLWYYMPDERVFLGIALVLFILFFIDYCLAYNNPYAYFSKGYLVKSKPESGFYVPLSYPLLMAFLLMILTWLRGMK